jgi:hypothetical protein
MPSRVVVLALLAVSLAACGGHRAQVRARVTAGHGDGIHRAVAARVTAGHGDGIHRAVPARVTAGHGDGIRYVVPAGWHVATRRLTPDLLNPRELLTAGTGPLPAGGRCAQNPSAALAAMRETDVLVTLQQRYGSAAQFPPRPRRFALPPATASEALTCAGPGAPIAVHTLDFRAGNRGFDALVAVGRAARARRVRAALALLDSLRVTPRRPVSIDSNSAIPYDDPSRGLHIVLTDGWRVYPRALTRAISARDQLAFGTFRLRQRWPDSNCTPTTALRERPRAGGFVFAFETPGGRGFPQLPARLMTSGPFECFGHSIAMQFSDNGRAFAAYIYGPRVRRAVAILESLRADPLPFSPQLRAARLPAGHGWRTWPSGRERGRCGIERLSWAARGDIAIAIRLYRCPTVYGVEALRPPLALAGGGHISGRFLGRYQVDVRVVYGRRHATAAQRAAAQRELSGVLWPARV